MTNNHWIVAGSLLILGATAACSGEPNDEPVQVNAGEFRLGFDENVEQVGRAAASGLEALRSAESADYYSNKIDLEERLCDSPLAGAWSDFQPPWNSRWGSYENTCPSYYSPRPTRLNVDSLVDQFLAEVSPAVFQDANLQDAGETSLTYVLDGEATCGSGECGRWIDDNELSLRVESPRTDDYDVSVQFGASNVEVFRVEAYQNQLAVLVDLSRLSEIIDPQSLPDVLEGQVRLGVDTSSGDAVLFVDVLREVHFAYDGVELRIEPGQRVMELSASETTGDVMLTFDMPTSSIEFVDSTYDFESGTTESDARLEIPSFYAEVIVEESSQDVQLNGLHFGSPGARLYFDDTLEAQLQLNEEEGERFSSTLSWVDGEFSYRVSPTFDTVLDMKFQRLRRVGVDLEAWMSDETMRAQFAGAVEPMLVYSEELLQVMDGELSLESEAVGDAFVVPSGECLGGGGRTSNPFDSFEVVPCF